MNDPKLDVLLTIARDAYRSGDSSDISDALRDLLMHFGVLSIHGDQDINELITIVRDQDHNLWRE